MNKSERKIPFVVKLEYFAMFIFLVFFEYQAYHYMSKGFDTTETISATYNTKSNTDYKVYLKENDFFEKEYLEKDNVYISSLIDYIDILFTYDLQFDNLSSGLYKYYIMGTIVAGSTDSASEYWAKEYILSEPETIDYVELKNINVTKNVKLDYQKYNELLKEFKKEYGLVINGSFKVKLIIESENDLKEYGEKVPVSSMVQLDIPLTQQTIEVKIDTSNNDVTKTVSKKVDVGNARNKIFLVIGIVSTILNFALLVVLFRRIMTLFTHKSEYEKELKRILATYSGIIVEAMEMPDISEIRMICLNNFEDLLDAHNEVRMPINYIPDETGYKADFIIIHANMGWIYTLKDVEYDNIKKKKEKSKVKKESKDITKEEKNK